MEDINKKNAVDAPVSPTGGNGSRMDEGSNRRLKTTVIVLAVIAAVLALVFAYVWYDRQQMIKDLTIDKENLTNELIELQGEYSQLSTDNDSLNVQLDREKEKVTQLLDRIQKTDAANRSKIRQYEKELGTLRSIMKHYIFQIDSLNTLNMALREDAEQARREAQKSHERYQELSKTTDEYAKLVAQGSEIKGRGINITGINASNKDTDRSSRIKKLSSWSTQSPVRWTIRARKWRYVYITRRSKSLSRVCTPLRSIPHPACSAPEMFFSANPLTE